jgi:hypothetical protein
MSYVERLANCSLDAISGEIASEPPLGHGASHLSRLAINNNPCHSYLIIVGRFTPASSAALLRMCSSFIFKDMASL